MGDQTKVNSISHLRHWEQGHIGASICRTSAVWLVSLIGRKNESGTGQEQTQNQNNPTESVIRVLVTGGKVKCEYMLSEVSG